MILDKREMVQRQIILDTETTGFYENHPDNPDRMIEFAGLEMKKRQLTGSHLHLYIHPQRDIPEEAFKVHGISLEMLEGKPVFSQVGEQIADYLRGAELIIHNAAFDVRFLDAEFARMGLPSIKELGCTITDTLAMAREKFPGQKNNLDALCNRLGVDRSKRVLHGALIDCELLAEVYLAMTREQFNLVDDLEETEEKVEIQVQHHEMVRPEYLKILYASEEEQKAHEAYLDDLDLAAGGQSIYRRGLN